MTPTVPWVDQRRDRDAVVRVCPGGGDAAVDGDRGIAGDRELVALERGRKDPLAVLVGEQRLVPVGQEPGRERDVLWDGLVGEVVEHGPALVAVGRQPVVEVELALGNAGPVRDVPLARRAEGVEVLREDGPCRLLPGWQRAWIDDELGAPRVVPVPGGRELDQREQRADEDHRGPRALRLGLVLEHAGADLRVRAGRLEELRELARDFVLVEVRVGLAPRAHAGLAGELGVGGVVVVVDEVQRQPVDRGLHDLLGGDRVLELCAFEAVQARRERDVGRGRVLGLQRREPPDRLGRRGVPALAQALAHGQRGGQLTSRKLVSHVARLHAA
jgi:hypothetical protein